MDFAVFDHINSKKPNEKEDNKKKAATPKHIMK